MGKAAMRGHWVREGKAPGEPRAILAEFRVAVPGVSSAAAAGGRPPPVVEWPDGGKMLAPIN